MSSHMGKKHKYSNGIIRDRRDNVRLGDALTRDPKSQVATPFNYGLENDIMERLARITISNKSARSANTVVENSPGSGGKKSACSPSVRIPIQLTHNHNTQSAQQESFVEQLKTFAMTPRCVSRRRHSESTIVKNISPPNLPRDRVSPLATPDHHRTISSPQYVSASPGGSIRCSGVTKANNYCARQVKYGPALSTLDPDIKIERFCYQHSKEIMAQPGFYSNLAEWINFEDWIPEYLQHSTQLALRAQMQKTRSVADEPGYIYTYEIRDSTDAATLKLKVGRSINCVKRIHQWSKQCGSKTQVLRGCWPAATCELEGSLMKGLFIPGKKGPWCHRLERLIHLELADLSLNAPYLDSEFPKMNRAASDSCSTTPRKGSVSPAGEKVQSKPCVDCGRVHREIFTFTRAEGGKFKNKEWENIVQPVIDKWGRFVEEHL